MSEQAVLAVEETAHKVATTAHVVEEAVHVAREEGLDSATLREALALAGTAVLTFVQWWLCGRGLHQWEGWEYDDGTEFDECSSCGRVREPGGVAFA